MRRAGSLRRGTSIPASHLPDIVRAIRAARGLTQEGLAREIGVTFSTVNGWENGKHVPIPVLASRLLEMARDAGISIEGVASPGLRRPGRGRGSV